eukprot:g20463.t1
MSNARSQLTSTLRNISVRTGVEVEAAVSQVLSENNHRVRQLESERSTLTTCVRQHRLALERERADRRTEQTALEDQVERHHTQVTNQVSLIRELEDKALASTERAERSREQLLSRDTRIGELNHEIENLKNEGSTLQEKLRNKTADATELQERLRIKVEECHDLSEKIDDLQKDTLLLRSDNASYRKTLGDVREKLSNAEHEVALVKSKLECLPAAETGYDDEVIRPAETVGDLLQTLDNICSHNGFLVEELDTIKGELKWYKDYHDYWQEQDSIRSPLPASTWVGFGQSSSGVSSPASDAGNAESTSGEQILTHDTVPVTTTPPADISPSNTSLSIIDFARAFIATDATRAHGSRDTYIPLTIEEISDDDNHNTGDAGNGANTSGATCSACGASHPLLALTDGSVAQAGELDALNRSTSIFTCLSHLSDGEHSGRSSHTHVSDESVAPGGRVRYQSRVPLDCVIPQLTRVPIGQLPTSSLLSRVSPVPSYQCVGVEESVQFGTIDEGQEEFNHAVVGFSGDSAGAPIANQSSPDANNTTGTDVPATADAGETGGDPGSDPSSDDSTSTSSSDTSSGTEYDDSLNGNSTDSGDNPRSVRSLEKRIRHFRRANNVLNRVIKAERSRNIANSQSSLRQFEEDKDRLYHRLRGEEYKKTSFLRRRVNELSNEKKYWEERATSTAEVRDRYKTQNDELLHQVADLECKLRDTGLVQGNSGWQDPSSWNDQRNWWDWGWRENARGSWWNWGWSD